MACLDHMTVLVLGTILKKHNHGKKESIFFEKIAKNARIQLISRKLL